MKWCATALIGLVGIGCGAANTEAEVDVLLGCSADELEQTPAPGPLTEICASSALHALSLAIPAGPTPSSIGGVEPSCSTRATAQYAAFWARPTGDAAAQLGIDGDLPRLTLDRPFGTDVEIVDVALEDEGLGYGADGGYAGEGRLRLLSHTETDPPTPWLAVAPEGADTDPRAEWYCPLDASPDVAAPPASCTLLAAMYLPHFEGDEFSVAEDLEAAALSHFAASRNLPLDEIRTNSAVQWSGPRDGVAARITLRPSGGTTSESVSYLVVRPLPGATPFIIALSSNGPSDYRFVCTESAPT